MSILLWFLIGLVALPMLGGTIYLGIGCYLSLTTWKHRSPLQNAVRIFQERMIPVLEVCCLTFLGWLVWMLIHYGTARVTLIASILGWPLVWWGFTGPISYYLVVDLEPFWETSTWWAPWKDRWGEDHIRGWLELGYMIGGACACILAAIIGMFLIPILLGQGIWYLATR